MFGDEHNGNGRVQDITTIRRVIHVVLAGRSVMCIILTKESIPPVQVDPGHSNYAGVSVKYKGWLDPWPVHEAFILPLCQEPVFLSRMGR